jgi:hypothetical protein
MNRFRIIAMAMSLLFLGHIVEAQVGANWTQATNAAPWTGRAVFGSATLNGQVWVLGGNGSGVFLNDVWSSSNGVTWIQAINAAPWGVRDNFGCTSFNGLIWVLGGYSGGFNYHNDVWSSSNGVTWTQVTAAAPWSARNDFGVVTLNGQIWVMGGYGVDGYLNDVWSSSNGVTWTQATSAAPWTARLAFGSVTLGGQMWVMGGMGAPNNISLNDVWSSSNGVTWTEATTAAPWSTRAFFGSTTLNGQMLVLGGTTNYGASASGFLNDVWSSSDGMIWTEPTNAAPWNARAFFGCATLNEQVWVMGGRDSNGNDLNDMWVTPYPGCDVAQLVPCAGPLSGGTWKNHGEYVRSVVEAASACLRESRLGLGP